MPAALAETELPLVEEYVNGLRRSGFEFPRNLTLISVQHLLGTNVTLFRAMFALGLKPERTFVLGKGYSDSSACAAALKETGVRVLACSSPPEPGNYADQRALDLRRFWADIGGTRILGRQGPVIIGDVGGRLLALVNSLNRECTLAGVEQTSSGLQRLQDQELSFPLVNLAKSKTKTVLESPLLAEEILRRFEIAKPGKLDGSLISVVGNGSVGSALCAALEKRRLRYELVDVAPQNTHNELAGMIGSSLARADVIFGCTGGATFESLPMDCYRPGQIFVSCSSEDVEFSSLCRLAKCGRPSVWPYPDLRIPVEGGEITVLVGGYPLNFDDTGVSIPEFSVQITTALTLAAFVHAARVLSSPTDGDPIVSLPEDTQTSLASRYLEFMHQ